MYMAFVIISNKAADEFPATVVNTTKMYMLEISSAIYSNPVSLSPLNRIVPVNVVTALGMIQLD